MDMEFCCSSSTAVLCCFLRQKCCWVPQPSPALVLPVYQYFLSGGYAFLDLPFLANISVDSIPISLCVSIQVQLRHSLVFTHSILIQLSVSYCFSRIPVPASTACTFSSCLLVWPYSAMLVSCLPFLIFCSWGLPGLMLCGRYPPRVSNSVLLSKDSFLRGLAPRRAGSLFS